LLATVRAGALLTRQVGQDYRFAFAPMSKPITSSAPPKRRYRGNVSRFYTYLMATVGVVCAYFIVRLLFFTDLSTRTIQSDVIQGILIGVGLAFVTAQVYGRIKGTKINGWVTMYGCGEPGNGMFLRAAHSWTFLGPINVPEEAMYWYTNSDGAGQALDGEQDYRLHFPAGQLPPNDAFWSLTMGDARNHFVPNPLNRYSVSDRSGLVPNADGSTDIYIQHTAPAEHEANWLPSPPGNFILWLRVYIPGATILDRTYTVPPVVRAK
jgi:hypothetical protein